MENTFHAIMVEAEAASTAAELAGARSLELRYGDPGYSLANSIYDYLHDRAMVAYMFADIASERDLRIDLAKMRARSCVNQLQDAPLI